MALKRKLTKEEYDELPEVLQAEYEEKDGTYFVQVEGMVPKSKLDEFRDNNIELKKQLSDAEKRLDGFGDMTPDDIEKLKKQATDKGGNFDEEKFKDAVEAELKKRTGKMTEEHQAEVQKLTDIINKSNSQLSTLVIDGAIADAAVKAGVVETAVDDIKLRARQVFKVEDGKAVPYNGEDVLYGKDGETPLSISEWLSDREKDSPHWFKPSGGSGSQPGQGGQKPGGAGNKNVVGVDRMKSARQG